MINPALDQAIQSILEQGSLSEFDLIKRLQQAPYSLFNQDVFNDELSLFQTHFVIHNSLYRLRDIGLTQGLYDIDTLTTQLQLLPLTSSDSSAITEVLRPEVAKLRSYYLDWDNFAKTDKQEVQNLLGQFWRCYANYDIHSNTETLNQALSAMGFDQIPSKQALKTKYKQLSNTYHPDKGGSAQQFSTLQHHYQTLKLFAR